MSYSSLADCIKALESRGELVRITEEVDPCLQMASIHLRIHRLGGPAILFENVKGCSFPALSNLFGTTERSRFIFQKTLPVVRQLVRFRNAPAELITKPSAWIAALPGAWHALPRQTAFNSRQWSTISLSSLPMIKHWPGDGGAFITLPQVLTLDPEKPGIKGSNLGMYRIQLNGNDYEKDKEIGLHYQLHRGIGVHQGKYQSAGKPMPVSIFTGGPPAHTFAAVMPLPEGITELSFAGVLGGRRFSYSIDPDGFVISNDADFVITGWVHPGELKPEGPFGDHLGYYSLRHDFPLMKVHKVYHRKNAIWPFTVVGRPPQEDTAFGQMIHEMTGEAIPATIPGLHEVYAVDEAGVHPLLLAIGSERYTPYNPVSQPAELLTIANHILGFGQLSLAKYLFIAAREDDPLLSTHHTRMFFAHMLARVNWERDLHFYTQTSIDTLDYSGEGLNSGSKVVIAATGKPLREPAGIDVHHLSLPDIFTMPCMIDNGIMAIQCRPFVGYEQAQTEMEKLSAMLSPLNLLSRGIVLLVICDDANFVSSSFVNFLWVTFTRSNPSHDIYGVDSFTRHKHWGCRGPLIIDARIKPFHAPALETDPEVEKHTDKLFTEGHSLYGLDRDA